jgi:hypothetical protein
LQVPLPPRNKTVLGEPLPPVVQEVLPAGAADRPSRRPRRDDLDEEEGDRPRRRVVCPYCRSREPPDVRSEMGQTGLILMIVLLFVFFPLFWIGFLIRDEVPYCSECGAKLGRSLF